jgi:putative chitinase
MNIEQFARCMEALPEVAKEWYPHFMKCFDRYKVEDKLQQAAMMAHAGHETGSLNRFTENLNYNAQSLMRMWPKRFPTLESAISAEHNQEKIANIAYGNRYGNGPFGTGDGWKYRGRGPFQITFADNYRACGKSLNLDLLGNPDLLLKPEHGAMAAGWYWTWKGCNSVALLDDIDATSDLINIGKRTDTVGDAHGYKDRQRRYVNCKAVLGMLRK